MPYLSRRALQGLKAYKYKPAGYTKLDELHTPFWNCELGSVGAGQAGSARAIGGRAAMAVFLWRRRPPQNPRQTTAIARPRHAGCVERLPLWLAPNLITLTGTMGLIIAYCVSMYYTPDFDGVRVTRVCVACVCGLCVVERWMCRPVRGGRAARA